MINHLLHVFIFSHTLPNLCHLPCFHVILSFLSPPACSSLLICHFLSSPSPDIIQYRFRFSPSATPHPSPLSLQHPSAPSSPAAAVSHLSPSFISPSLSSIHHSTPPRQKTDKGRWCACARASARAVHFHVTPLRESVSKNGISASFPAPTFKTKWWVVQQLHE